MSKGIEEAVYRKLLANSIPHEADEDDAEIYRPEDDPSSIESAVLRDIQRFVCTRYSISNSDFLSHRRYQDLVRARQIAMWLMRELTTASYPTIGFAFGNRDHTTVMHGVRKINVLLQKDLKLAKTVLAMRFEICLNCGCIF